MLFDEIHIHTSFQKGDYSKGTIGEVDEDLKSFLNYMTTGIADGAFAKEFDDAAQRVKSKEEDRYMTYQMDLLGRELDGEARGEQRGRESIAMKMLKKGNSFDLIAELTDLSIERIRELAAQIGKTGIQTA